MNERLVYIHYLRQFHSLFISGTVFQAGTLSLGIAMVIWTMRNYNIEYLKFAECFSTIIILISLNIEKLRHIANGTNISIFELLLTLKDVNGTLVLGHFKHYSLEVLYFHSYFKNLQKVRSIVDWLLCFIVPIYIKAQRSYNPDNVIFAYL